MNNKEILKNLDNDNAKMKQTLTLLGYKTSFFHYDTTQDHEGFIDNKSLFLIEYASKTLMLPIETDYYSGDLNIGKGLVVDKKYVDFLIEESENGLNFHDAIYMLRNSSINTKNVDSFKKELEQKIQYSGLNLFISLGELPNFKDILLCTNEDYQNEILKKYSIEKDKTFYFFKPIEKTKDFQEIIYNHKFNHWLKVDFLGDEQLMTLNEIPNEIKEFIHNKNGLNLEKEFNSQEIKF